jgi:hypothetical protein
MQSGFGQPTAHAVNPTPSAAPSATPGPPPGGGEGGEGEGPEPSCSGGAPGLITSSGYTPLNVVVLFAEAGSPSDLLLTQPNQLPLVPDATDNVFTSATAGEYLVTTSFEFAIFTPQFGTTRTSTGAYGKVLQEAPGSWLVCFEDGSDGDFDDLVIRVWTASCDAETPVDLPPSDPVKVSYDPRYLWTPSDPLFLEKAAVMAEAIRSRAVAARDAYRNIFDDFGAQDDVPDHLDIHVECQLPWWIHAPAFTESQDSIRIKTESLKQWLLSAEVGVGYDPSPVVVGSEWADTIDHEVLHTLQYKAMGDWPFAMRYLGGDYANLEGSAVVGQDLQPDFDDLADDEDSTASFRSIIGAFLEDHSAITLTSNDGIHPYAAAGFLQYLGERYGTRTPLEARVAEFIRATYRGGSRLAGLASATSRTETQVVDALRDFYVALYTREASNATSLAHRYRILDETTLSGASPTFEAPDPGLSWGVLNPGPPKVVPFSESASLEATAAAVYELPVAPGTSQLRVTIHAQHVGGRTPNDRLRLAFVPKTDASGSENVITEWLSVLTGPGVGKTSEYELPAAGLSKLGVIAVAGTTKATYTIDVSALSGPAGLTIDDVGTVIAGHSIPVFVHPTVGGIGARKQPLSAFSATIDGSPATVTAIFDQGSKAKLHVRSATVLSAGTHALVVTYQIGGSSATASDSFTVVAGGPPTISLDAPQLGGAGSAGTAIEISTILSDDLVGIPGATVTATVTDPNGVARTFPLIDVGAEYDAGYDDGAYGATVTGTQVPGTYAIEITASGLDGSGNPYTVTSSGSTALGAIVDGDGDGVADAVELELDLDPADPSDGATDVDGDGAGSATELAAGSDPVDADTDQGGEADGSELAAGRSPLTAADDEALPEVTVGALAKDGRTVEVTVAASDGTTPVRVLRVGPSSTTDLGLHPGAGQTFTDGPLVAGEYHYDAAAESASGARGVIVSSNTVVARDDATAPFARLLVAAGATLTSDAAVPIAFIDRSETPTEMRLAESEADLETAPWVPFLAETTFSLDATAGAHSILAELRDAASNESGAIGGSIVLDLSPPTSTAGALPVSTLSSFVYVPYTASDDYALGGVELYVRYRPTPNAGWTSWARATMGMSSPIYYSFNNGPGFYEFASVAADAAGNRETLPASGDAPIRYGPEIVNDDTGTASQSSPRARTGLDGNVYAVWTDARNSVSLTDLYFAKRNATAETWGTNERVDDAAVAVSNGSIAVDSAGNAYAVWVDARSGNKDIYFSKRSVASGTWSTSVRINDDTGTAVQDNPAIAVSSTGEAIAVWVDNRSNKINIYSARLAAGGSTWSANYKVSADGNNPKNPPDLVIGADGIAYATWPHLKNGKWVSFFSSLPSGGTTWSSNVQLSDSTKSQGSPRIGVDGAGTLLVVYLDGSTAVLARRRPAGTSTWSAPTTISSVASGRPPAIGVRANGVGYAVWNDNSLRLYGARYEPSTQTWGPQQQITTTTNHADPTVGLISGTAIIVVEEGAIGSPHDIRALAQAVP